MEKNCEHPMRLVETVVVTHYCRICGYQKTITATKEYENEYDPQDRKRTLSE